MAKEQTGDCFMWSIYSHGDVLEIMPLNNRPIIIQGQKGFDHFMTMITGRSQKWRLFLFFRILAIVLVYTAACAFLWQADIRPWRVCEKRKSRP